ncbi:MAG: hypothetical protein HC831_08060 [Chloroflexia bacterium]|nr:hypothetical protein [Chloroflexia bacterium]
MSYRVKDSYRTNPKSIIPGGLSIFVRMADGRVFEYDKIKNPLAYIRKLEEGENNIKEWWIKK